MMGFLSSVDSLMNSQSRSLDEHLSTIRPVTNVRSNTAVDALYYLLEGAHMNANRSELTVASKIAPSCEGFAACTAGVLFCRLLRCRCLLWHLLHGHVVHAAHSGHVWIARYLHSSGHRVGDMHRRLHHRWGRVSPSDAMGSRVVGVFRTVRRD